MKTPATKGDIRMLERFFVQSYHVFAEKLLVEQAPQPATGLLVLKLEPTCVPVALLIVFNSLQPDDFRRRVESQSSVVVELAQPCEITLRGERLERT